MADFPFHGDNFRTVDGPIIVKPVETKEREALPVSVRSRIRAMHESGKPPGQIACGCSTRNLPVTKNAVLRVLAGGLS